MNLNFCIITQVAEEMQDIYTGTDISEAQSKYAASKTALETSNATYNRFKKHFDDSRQLLEEARVRFEEGLKVEVSARNRK